MILSAFKAYDIRGKYPQEVNEDLAYHVGRAVAKYFKAKTIVVGRDMRNSSPTLADALINGITDQGCDVVNIGMCTTPMLNFAVANYNYDGGIMISASHNPGGDNAFKVINKDVIQLDEIDGLNDIKKLIEDGINEAVYTRGNVVPKDMLNDYRDHIVNRIGSVKPLKVVADYGNGVGAISAEPVLKSLGLDVVPLFATPDGNFPNHPANPHDLANFSQLIEKVKAEKADVGLFFDGDADRANFVDDNGRIVPIDLLTILLAQAELRTEPGNVYYDLRFSKAVPMFIRQAGGNPVMMRVGNPFYKRVLRQKGGVIGSEFAGHIMFPENFNIDDGLFAALKTIKLIGDSGKKLSQLIDGVTILCASPEESMEAKTPDSVFERLYEAFPDTKRVDLDGVYLDFGDDGFISVRQSQNERQLFRIRVEAKAKQTMESRFEKVKQIVLNG